MTLLFCPICKIGLRGSSTDSKCYCQTLGCALEYPSAEWDADGTFEALELTPDEVQEITKLSEESPDLSADIDKWVYKGTKETIQLPLDRFRDKNGLPTCGYNFRDSACYCKFYATQRFGLECTCVLAPPSLCGGLTNLESRESGSLIPGDFCPLWKKEEK